MEVSHLMSGASDFEESPEVFLLGSFSFTRKVCLAKSFLSSLLALFALSRCIVIIGKVTSE